MHTYVSGRPLWVTSGQNFFGAGLRTGKEGPNCSIQERKTIVDKAPPRPEYEGDGRNHTIDEVRKTSSD
jgi:hypothetical protein